MAHFDDLTPYEYAKNKSGTPLPVLNVGWLSDTRPYEVGDTSQEFKDALYRFCLDEQIVMIMRGFHACEICGLSMEAWWEKHPDYGSQAHWMGLGDGEIRVIGRSIIYAAPALIYHYVIEHGYKPPDEFIEAVLTGPQPGSNEHMRLLESYRTG